MPVEVEGPLSVTNLRTFSPTTKSKVSDDLVTEKMSSKEVAELAQAIHNHADVLYESWKKGQEAFNMKRMEDTLELLADPGLTPKLEHLVSTFVRRDKEKRQQFQQHLSPDESDKRETSPLGGSPRKPLPKSILAVVQRFEPKKTGQEIISNNLIQRERSPVAENLVRFNVPGVGPVTKNVVWAESINKHNVSEKIGDRSSPTPSPTPVNIKSYLEPSPPPPRQNNQSHINNDSLISRGPTSPNNGVKTVIHNISPTGKTVRERHIPIERVDEGSNVNVKPVAPRFNSPSRNLSSVGIQLTIPDGTISNFKNSEIHDLEQEEEKLFRALRTGQVLVPKYSPANNHNSSIPPREKAPPTTQEINGNANSRVAFAKERIRHSQEHPMTQQRLELQKRLPSPSGNLAAAIAVQQGKLKFQPVNGTSHMPLDDVTNNNAHNRESGRNSFVRFGPGATVADRVQLFEKYPTHISSPIVHSKSSSPVNNSPVHITHPIHIQHNTELIPLGRDREDSPIPQIQIKSHHYTPVNSSAPWRTSPGRELQHHVQQTESTPAPEVRKQTVSSSLKRSVDKPRLVKDVPRFYWPEGKPSSNLFVQESLAKAEDHLKLNDNSLLYSKFGDLLVTVGIPLYWKKPFWMALCLSPDASCSSKVFIPFLRYLLGECPDEASRFARVISSAARNFPDAFNGSNGFKNKMNQQYYQNHRSYCLDLKYVELSMSDFIPMIQDIIDTHPGLGFLRDAPEFHSRYITTVISRIFYKVNRSWSGRLTLPEIRRSNVLRIIRRLEEETDINSITEYFSYEHFYVIYCKFWELDKDHDLLIDKHDLAAHADHALSSRIIDRIFSGTVLRGWDVTSPVRVTHDKMTYSDFVWFLISEEDKKTPTAVEYWFRCLDVDGDGVISPYELQYFYSEQESRIETLGIEPLHFSNVYCQIVDMLHCSPTGIRLRDLKRNPYLAANVFNTVFNLDKYLEHEQRDPFAAAASLGNPENAEGESDWDKFAAAEYELLIAEEAPSEHLHDSGLEEVLTP